MASMMASTIAPRSRLSRARELYARMAAFLSCARSTIGGSSIEWFIPSIIRRLIGCRGVYPTATCFRFFNARARFSTMNQLIAASGRVSKVARTKNGNTPSVPSPMMTSSCWMGKA